MIYNKHGNLILKKEERLMAYDAVLRELVMYPLSSYICPRLDQYLKLNFGIPIGAWDIKYTFPELYNQKPFLKKRTDGWWPLSQEGRLKRIEALKNAKKRLQKKL